MADVKDKLLEIISEDCELEDAHEKQHDWSLFTIEGIDKPDWGMDSLQTLELIIAVEREFNVKLDDAEKTIWVSFNRVAKYVEENKS